MRYEYDKVAGLIHDREDYNAVVVVIENQRQGNYVVDILNKQDDEIKKLKKELKDVRGRMQTQL